MSCCCLELEAGFLGSMRNVRAGGSLGLESACTKDKKDLAFSVKGGVAEHYRHLV